MFFANSLYPFLTGKYKEGVTDLDRLAAPALVQIFRRSAKKYQKAGKLPALSKGQKKQARSFYKKYAGFDLLYHRVYTGQSGEFHPDYMPDDLYFKRVEPYFTDRLCSRALDNKCFYYSFFSNVRQPGLVVMRVGASWLDGNLHLISFEKACQLVAAESACAAKRAVMSEGGHGVVFLEGDSRLADFQAFVKDNQTDLIVQKQIRQHPIYAGLHKESVNTLRLMSLLTRDGVKVFAAVVRIGTGDSRVDNFSSGGLFVGIGPDGRLTERGVLDDGRVVKRHPDLHYSFSGCSLPCYDKAVKLVEEAHGIMAHCRLAAWDIAIDVSGEAVLIETNLSLAIIHGIQVCNGPLFGPDTRKILDEVWFGRSGRKRKRPYFGLNPRDYYYLRDKFLSFIKFVQKKSLEFNVATDVANIDAGETMSNRNVSTSRLADRIGAGDVVARSETVLLEKDDGSFQRANSMEGVETKSMDELMKDAAAHKYKVSYSGQAIRQLYQLQILDLICGQVDRHLNNFNVFYELDKDSSSCLITSVKGIDNDMSFGGGMGFKQLGHFTQQRLLLDKEGRITVPFLPKDFYHKVINYTPEMAAYDQMDLRSRKEIEALQSRLKGIQNQLMELVAAKKITLLDTDEEWEQAKEKLKKMRDAGQLNSYNMLDLSLL